MASGFQIAKYAVGVQTQLSWEEGLQRCSLEPRAGGGPWGSWAPWSGAESQQGGAMAGRHTQGQEAGGPHRAL